MDDDEPGGARTYFIFILILFISLLDGAFSSTLFIPPSINQNTVVAALEAAPESGLVESPQSPLLEDEAIRRSLSPWTFKKAERIRQLNPVLIGDEVTQVICDATGFMTEHQNFISYSTPQYLRHRVLLI